MSASTASGPRGRTLAGPTVAVLAKRGRFTVAEPLFDRGRQITLEGGRRPGASVGEMVLLGYGKHGPRAVRSLGRPDVARDVLEAPMLDRGLRRSLPRAVAVEAAAGAAGAGRRPPELAAGRAELRRRRARRGALGGAAGGRARGRHGTTRTPARAGIARGRVGRARGRRRLTRRGDRRAPRGADRVAH